MKKFFALLSFLLLFACELIVDVDVPFEHQRLTMNTSFNPDSLWTTQLTLNRHVLDEEPFREVNNAQVIIYEEDNPIDTLMNKGSGMYQSDAGKPAVGKVYKIVAVAEGFEPVIGESSVPIPAEIVSSVVTETTPNHEQHIFVKMKFKDDPAEKNYYQVFFDMEQEYYDFTIEKVLVQHYRYQLTSQDPVIQNENDEYASEIIFKDVLFNGKEIELTFEAFGYGPLNAGLSRMTLRTLSEDYYKYLTTSSLQRNTSGDPFAQPVNVYNNVQNGFGIFAGYSTSTHTDNKPKPVISSISPAQGKAGDHIIITGDNFGNSAENFVRVAFKANSYMVFAQVVQHNDNQLEVIVPNNAVTGKIMVDIGRIAVSETDFQITN